MGFLTPTTAFIAAGICIPLLLAMYLLKRRRQEVLVSSTLLWRKAIEDLQVNAPFQTLRRNLLLLLQLLALMALLLVLARPTLRGASEPGQRVIVILDHSASMNATDVTPTRLDRAKDAALALIDDLASGPLTGATTALSGAPSQGGGAMIISFAHRATVVQPFTTDVALLRAAVRSVPPTDQAGQLDRALRLIEPFAAQAASGAPDPGKVLAPLIVYVISDAQASSSFPILPGAELRFVRTGTTDAENLAITQLAARRDTTFTDQVRVITKLSNYTTHAITTHLKVKLAGHARMLHEVTVPPRTEARALDHSTTPGTHLQHFNVRLAGPTILEVSHSHADHLPADNTAYIVMTEPREPRVLLISPGPAESFLTHVLNSAGANHVTKLTAEQYEARAHSPDDPPDMLVFVGHSPQRTPNTHSLYFNAAPPIVGLRLAPPTDELGPQPVLDWDRHDTLLRHVALDDLLIINPGRLVLPDTGHTLCTGRIGPLIARTHAETTRHVVVAFDPLDSNWPMQIGFPVFIRNILHANTMRGSQSGVEFRPGQIVAVPAVDGSDHVIYDGPSEIRSVRRVAGKTSVLLPAFRRAGLYSTKQPVSDSWRNIAVNLLDESESSLAKGIQNVPANMGAHHATATISSTGAMIRHEIWRWPAAAALILLIIEWLVYTRRMHL